MVVFLTELEISEGSSEVPGTPVNIRSREVDVLVKSGKVHEAVGKEELKGQLCHNLHLNPPHHGRKEILTVKWKYGVDEVD